MSFKMVVDLSAMDIQTGRLRLPKTFSRRLPTYTVTITLVDYLKRRFQANIDSYDAETTWLYGTGWTSYLQTITDTNITTLYFSLRNENIVEVSAFPENRIEVRLFMDKPPVIHSYLAVSDGNIYQHQALPQTFLSFLNRRTSEFVNDTVTLYGPYHNAKVVVTYTPTDGYQYGVATGFEGAAWTEFCLQHNIQENYTIKFTNLGSSNEDSHIFSVEIFNNLGISIFIKNSHICSQFGHVHNINNPRFYRIIRSQTLSTKAMVIPHSFVMKHRLFTYHTAIIAFRNQSFPATLQIKLNSRIGMNQPNMFMLLDWEEFLVATGLYEGKKLRFELKPERRLRHQDCYFEVC